MSNKVVIKIKIYKIITKKYNKQAQIKKLIF